MEHPSTRSPLRGCQRAPSRNPVHGSSGSESPRARGITPALLALAVIAWTAAMAPAQDDLRDRVVKKNGKVVTGRIVVPTAPKELLVLQGGRRVRIERSDIQQIDRVADRVREFCERRLKLKGSPRAQWFLVEWAESRGLPGLARAQAMLLALDDNHEQAHEFLGHRKTSKGWLYAHAGRNLSRAKFEAALEKKNFEIVGERFKVRCDGRVRAAVAALLDLEYLGVAFYDRFGEGLQLREALQPVLVDISYSDKTFQKWGFRPQPYFRPPPHGDVARTFYRGIAPTRPERLFFVATQGLLYRSLIGEVNQQSDRDRICPWLEIGLGMHLENVMEGPAGFAFPGRGRRNNVQASQTLSRGFRMSSLLHLPMYGGYYLMDDTPTATHWAASTMLVTWLLDKDNRPPTRDAFFNYMRQALGDRLGDSSTLFDRAMGRRIEELEEPFSKWLVEQTKK
ncbi:MAG: hypothetical protein NXI31_24255 [bacterium]|nr:hypothetical protein [bacterium]